MAEWAAELSRAAEKRTALEGTVRITAPPGVAFDLVVPLARWMKTKLPGITLEVVSSVRYLDLARREADLALRMQRVDQKDLIVVRSLALEGVPFAARELAERLGPRPRPADVPWIAWAPPLEETLPNPVLARLIPGFRPAFASDDYLVQLCAAEAGLGAMFLAHMRHRFSRESALVPLSVEGIAPYPSSLSLVCAKSALAIPRIRAVADLLEAELAKVATGVPKRRTARR
jgi:DNA-binding transcriptional LysR family regulator